MSVCVKTIYSCLVYPCTGSSPSFCRITVVYSINLLRELVGKFLMFLSPNQILEPAFHIKGHC